MPSTSVTVTNPTGSSRWYRSQSHSIQWSHTLNLGQTVDHFEIRLYKGSSLDTVIATNKSSSSSSHGWSVPSSQTEGTDYRIQLKMVLVGGGEVQYTDYSGYFDIHEKYHITTLSDTSSLAEALSKTIATYRTDRSISDTISSAESLSKTISTWRFVNTLSNTITLGDSFSKLIDTWEHIRSLSESISTSESFTQSIQTWRFITNLSETISTSESFTKAVQTWRFIRSFSDTISLFCLRKTLTFCHFVASSYGSQNLN